MKKLILASAASALFALPVMGWAHGVCDDETMEHCAYVHNASGVYVKDSAGSCVRTSFWKPGTHIEGCDAPMVMSDADNDGVADADDHCPGTPAGAPVDEVGCPKDSDWDGVPDYMDKCPETFGAVVNAEGCVEAAMVLMEVNLNVKFATDSAKINSDYDGDIKKVADFMKKSEGSTVFIEGHTDSTGSEGYNEALSLKRAEAVAGTLIYQYGIAESRVNSVGYGESRPVADNKTAEGRAANRRVVAIVKGLVEK